MLKKKWLIGLFGICFLGGFLLVVAFQHRPRVKMGDHYIYCNPGAKVKPDRVYNLRLWDTDWPVLAEGAYKAYLEGLISDFQKIYPNIRVKISLLELGDGPSQLAAALKTNSAPDVYCSAFTIPAFNYKRQIPVGFYLKLREKGAYFPEARKLVTIDGIEGCFPRWLAPTVWIGNQKLLDALGLPVLRMQKTGYSWEELLAVLKKLSKGKYILVGNIGHNGFFTDLAVNSTIGTSSTGFLPQSGIKESLNLLHGLIIQGQIPVDFESNMLGRFLTGNSLMLAGVRPLIYRFLRLKLMTTADQKRCQPILLPSPGKRKKFLLTESGVVCIYRNKWNNQDDQIAAAVQLGKFISTYHKTRPFQELMLLPAAMESAARWREELRPVVGDVSSLIHQVENSSLLNLPDYQVYQKEIYPVLYEFFARKASLASVYDKLISVKW